MRIEVIVRSAVAALALIAIAQPSYARNPHCAGGIQYVVQAMRDKEKGSLEDYRREISKAVQQLEQCSSEDPNDFESIAYQGWAYAEVESAGPAGKAFDVSIAGLKQKGDKKKAEWAENNRESYWATWFNDGIKQIDGAQHAYANITKKPENPGEEAQKAEATKLYAKALDRLTMASLVKPNDPRTMRNLGAVYAFQGHYDEAEKVFAAALKVAPNDTDLVNSIRGVRRSQVDELMDAKKCTEAIGFYTDLLKTEPTDSELQAGLADAYFKRALTKEGDARKPDFKAAGDAYAKAAQLKPGGADLPFNSALAYQNAGEFNLAEGQWRATLKLRPDDVDAMSALGATLAELKKYDQGIAVLFDAVNRDPKDKNRHRQLGALYTKAGNNPKATEELMVYLALQNGKAVADAAAQAKGGVAGAAGAKLIASAGNPEDVYPWEADGQKYETWFYWAKKHAYHFQSSTLVQESNWAGIDKGAK